MELESSHPETSQVRLQPGLESEPHGEEAETTSDYPSNEGRNTRESVEVDIDNEEYMQYHMNAEQELLSKAVAVAPNTAVPAVENPAIENAPTAEQVSTPGAYAYAPMGNATNHSADIEQADHSNDVNEDPTAPAPLLEAILVNDDNDEGGDNPVFEAEEIVDQSSKQTRYILAASSLAIAVLLTIILALTLRKDTRTGEEDTKDFNSTDESSIKCFESNAELREAVELYHREGFANNASNLSQTYGWPMGNWCVEEIEGGIFSTILIIRD